MARDQALYLRVGDKVFHRDFARWGTGVVVEERNSELPGGFCYVRINFGDGKLRVFDNNLKSECCCYYAGIEIIESGVSYIDIDDSGEESTARKRKKALSGNKH